MSVNVEEVEKIKNAIDKAKTEKAELAGTLNNQLETLKNEFGVNHIADAKQLLKKLKTEESALQKEIEEALPELKESLNRWL